jgi:Ca-activated chloride channel family protein
VFIPARQRQKSDGLRPAMAYSVRRSVRPAARTRLLFYALLTVLTALAAAEDGENVHVLPGSNSFLSRSASTVRATVDLVLVNVTVLDQSGRAVSGLRARDFSLLDNKLSQDIRYFSSEDAPLSVTVVLDASGSMAAKIQKARRAVNAFFDASNLQDEFRLLTVSDRPELLSDNPGSFEDMERALAVVQPEGKTALWDTVYLAVTGLREARHPRKAVLIISDGGDNHSRYTEGELKKLLQEAGVQVYAIGLFDRNATRLEERLGPLRLDAVTHATGGRLFAVHDSKELAQAVTQIGSELRNQYVLGYYPRSPEHAGKWHKLKVRPNTSPPSAKLRVFARAGYYGPAE